MCEKCRYGGRREVVFDLISHRKKSRRFSKKFINEQQEEINDEWSGKARDFHKHLVQACLISTFIDFHSVRGYLFLYRVKTPQMPLINFSHWNDNKSFVLTNCSQH